MRLFSHLSLGLAASVAFSGIAVGQRPPSTGSLLGDPAARMAEGGLSAADAARQTMNDYAVCLVRMRAVSVRRALTAGPAPAVDEALSRLAVSDCLQSGMLRMPARLLRGSIYRAMYLRDFGRAPDTVAAPATAVGQAAAADPLLAFGSCVDTIDHSNTRAMIMAAPASRLEQQALTALGPALAQCVAPGSQIRFTRSVLQGALAEAAYRRATSSSPVNN